ncbi:MAG: 1-acyl-sn-glycerol-3-phosphate acyltransferase [Silvanigrellaceae bacterium]
MFRLLGIHFSRWLFLLTPIRALFRLELTPTEEPETWIKKVTSGKDVIYVVPRMSVLDLLAVNKALKRLGMPRVWHEARPNRFRKTALLSMRPRKISFLPRSRVDFFSPAVSKLMAEDHRIKRGELVILPVQVFWSRVPDRSDRNILLRSLFPDEGTENVFQKYFMLLIHGGLLRVHFGQPLELSQVAQGEELLAGRRLRRTMLIEFQRERTAACGPVVYDLATVSQRILASHDIKKLVNQSDNPAKQMRKAAHYLREIASKYNYSTIRAMETVLDFVWTRIFQGVRVRNLDAVAQITKQGQIIWIPCHRSHLDYLLLSYLMKRKGLAPPHIAAGVNLSFFPAGPVLRRGGAFFLRRSFAGNKLYSAVFSNYVDFLLTNGHPVEFFHEGGRSRIGKLLVPKTGMTAMCVNSILKRRAENTYFCPVFISYDKVMEDNSYARELSGAKKEAESFFQLIRSLRYLFSNYGRVEVAFGTPVRFGDFWTDYVSRTQAHGGRGAQNVERVPLPLELSSLPADFDLRDSRVQAMVRELAKRINQGINACATASDTALLASVVLGRSHASAESDNELDVQLCLQKVSSLRRLLERCGSLLGWAISAGEPGEMTTASSEVELITSNAPQLAVADEAKKRPPDLVSSAVKWGFLQTRRDANGRHLLRPADSAQLNLWWYRGTIFHLLSVPGIVATILERGLLSTTRSDSAPRSVSISALEYQTAEIRRLWDDELFWPETTSTATIVLSCLEIFEELELVRRDRAKETVSLVEKSESQQTLQWISGLVRPEIELYSVQLGAAVQLSQEESVFKRDELVSLAARLHRSAFLRGHLQVQSQLSGVFGGRIFDSYSRAGVFAPAEGVGMSLVYSQLSSLSEFLQVERWRDYSL